ISKVFPSIPHNWTSTFGKLHGRDYIELLRRTIVDAANPENVALLEIEPEQQKTRIDFACSESLWRTPIVSLGSVEKQGRKLFYRRDGRQVRIERIYNRVIFDELERRKDVHAPFRFQEELDV